MLQVNDAMSLKNKNLIFLVVEDMVSDSFLLQRQIKKLCEEPEIRFVDGKLSLINALKSYVPDFIICDFNLNGFDAFEVIDIVNDYNSIIPVIVITGHLKNEKDQQRLMDEGASGFFLKDPMDELHQRMKPLFQKLLVEREEQMDKIDAKRREIDSYRKKSDYFRAYGKKGKKLPGIVNYFKRLFLK